MKLRIFAAALLAGSRRGQQWPEDFAVVDNHGDLVAFLRQCIAKPGNTGQRCDAERERHESL